MLRYHPIYFKMFLPNLIKQNPKNNFNNEKIDLHTYFRAGWISVRSAKRIIDLLTDIFRDILQYQSNQKINLFLWFIPYTWHRKNWKHVTVLYFSDSDSDSDSGV